MDVLTKHHEIWFLTVIITLYSRGVGVSVCGRYVLLAFIGGWMKLLTDLLAMMAVLQSKDIKNRCVATCYFLLFSLRFLKNHGKTFARFSFCFRAPIKTMKHWLFSLNQMSLLMNPALVSGRSSTALKFFYLDVPAIKFCQKRVLFCTIWSLLSRSINSSNWL